MKSVSNSAELTGHIRCVVLVARYLYMKLLVVTTTAMLFNCHDTSSRSNHERDYIVLRSSASQLLT